MLSGRIKVLSDEHFVMIFTMMLSAGEPITKKGRHDMSVQKEEIIELFEKLNDDEKESTYNYLQFLASLNADETADNEGEAVAAD